MSANVRQLLATCPKPQILPALLECDYARLGAVCDECKHVGASILHLDVMDGHFVPNLTYGPPLIRSLRKATSLVLDAHLMISNPAKYVDEYCQAGCDIVTIHIEAVPDPRAFLARIRQHGALAGLTLNPPTPLDAIKPFLDDCDLVLPLSVMAGFGGQKFDPVVIEKLQWLRQHGPKHLILESDGGLNRETIGRVTAAGADLLVVGSALFRAADFAAEFKELSRLAHEAMKNREPRTGNRA
jgi:ribulose-phosphate 3-epimerase